MGLTRALFAPSKKVDCKYQGYHTSKIYVNKVDRKFNKFKWDSIRLCCFACISDLTILFISSLNAGGKPKLKESGKKFSFMLTTLG